MKLPRVRLLLCGESLLLAGPMLLLVLWRLSVVEWLHWLLLHLTMKGVRRLLMLRKAPRKATESLIGRTVSRLLRSSWKCGGIVVGPTCKPKRIVYHSLLLVYVGATRKTEAGCRSSTARYGCSDTARLHTIKRCKWISGRRSCRFLWLTGKRIQHRIG